MSSIIRLSVDVNALKLMIHIFKESLMLRHNNSSTRTISILRINIYYILYINYQVLRVISWRTSRLNDTVQVVKNRNPVKWLWVITADRTCKFADKQQFVRTYERTNYLLIFTLKFVIIIFIKWLIGKLSYKGTKNNETENLIKKSRDDIKNSCIVRINSIWDFLTLSH